MQSEHPGQVVAVSGSGGLIGAALCEGLQAAGHRLRRIVRTAPAPGSADIHWDIPAGRIDAEALEGSDVVIHLAGENIGAGRWSTERKQQIRSSRIEGTLLLSDTLARMQRKPAVFLCASAIGIYGNRGSEALDENSSSGSGFLAELVRDWESACQSSRDAGIRVANLRFGMVLDSEDGALAKMLPPFRMGAGGPMGDGRQYMSWITLGDLVRAIQFVMGQDELAGPVNLCAPEPVTNADFADALGKALGRPAMIRVPAFAIRAMFGEMGQALVLDGARVMPGRLLDSGFAFRHPEILAALKHTLRESR